MKEFENDPRKCKDILCSCTEEFKLLKYPYYQKQSTGLMHLYQNTHGIFHRKKILKFIWKYKDPKFPNQTWEKNKAGGLLPKFRL